MEIVEIWQNLEKKRNTDHDFPSYYMWAENNNVSAIRNTATMQLDHTF